MSEEEMETLELLRDSYYLEESNVTIKEFETLDKAIKILYGLEP